MLLASVFLHLPNVFYTYWRKVPFRVGNLRVRLDFVKSINSLTSLLYLSPDCHGLDTYLIYQPVMRISMLLRPYHVLHRYDGDKRLQSVGRTVFHCGELSWELAFSYPNAGTLENLRVRKKKSLFGKHLWGSYFTYPSCSLFSKNLKEEFWINIWINLDQHLGYAFPRRRVRLLSAASGHRL